MEQDCLVVRLSEFAALGSIWSLTDYRNYLGKLYYIYLSDVVAQFTSREKKLRMERNTIILQFAQGLLL